MLSKSVLYGAEKSPLQTLMDAIARLPLRLHLLSDFLLLLPLRFLRVPDLLEPPNLPVKLTGYPAASAIQRYMGALHQLVYAAFHFQGYLADTQEVATMNKRFVPPLDHGQIPDFLRTPHVELNFFAGGIPVAGTLCGKP